MIKKIIKFFKKKKNKEIENQNKENDKKHKAEVINFIIKGKQQNKVQTDIKNYGSNCEKKVDRKLS